VKKIFFLLCFFSLRSFACNTSNVIAEISKYHGSNWSDLVSSKNCSRTKVKDSLKEIITKADIVLNEYDSGLKKFLLRNAITALGNFVQLEGESKRSLNTADAAFFEELYLNPNSVIGSDVFAQDSRFIQLKALESYSKTGSVQALEFLTKEAKSNSKEYLRQSSLKNLKRMLTGVSGESTPGVFSFQEYLPNLSEPFDQNRFSDEIEEVKKISFNQDNIKNYQNQGRAIASGDQVESVESKESIALTNMTLKEGKKSSDDEGISLWLIFLLGLFALIITIYLISKRAK
jgi:hypothetical protein